MEAHEISRKINHVQKLHTIERFGKGQGQRQKILMGGANNLGSVIFPEKTHTAYTQR